MTRIEISDREILECTSAKAALRMSLDRSSSSLKSVSIDIGTTESQLSRALNSYYDVTLRHDLIVPFMASCGNAIYLRWLYLHLKELLPEMDKDQRLGDVEMIGAEVEELRLMLREAVDEIKAARPSKPCSECGAHFALTREKGIVPSWLLTDALWIEFEIGEEI